MGGVRRGGCLKSMIQRSATHAKSRAGFRRPFRRCLGRRFAPGAGIAFRSVNVLTPPNPLARPPVGPRGPRAPRASGHPELPAPHPASRPAPPAASRGTMWQRRSRSRSRERCASSTPLAGPAAAPDPPRSGRAGAVARACGGVGPRAQRHRPRPRPGFPRPAAEPLAFRNLLSLFICWHLRPWTRARSVTLVGTPAAAAPPTRGGRSWRRQLTPHGERVRWSCWRPRWTTSRPRWRKPATRSHSWWWRGGQSAARPLRPS
jgi:hypothetical protein